MAITIDRVPIQAEDAQALATAACAIPDAKRRLLRAGGGAIVVGVAILVLALAAFRLPGATCALGGVAIALVPVLAVLMVSALGWLEMLKAARHSTQSVAIAAASGTVEIIRTIPTAAWSVRAVDEDTDAVLFRCDDRFIYVNGLDHLVDDLDAVPVEVLVGYDADPNKRAGGVSQSGASASDPWSRDRRDRDPVAPPRVRSIVTIRRWPAPAYEILEIVAGTEWLPLGTLPHLAFDDPHFRAIAVRPDWNAAILSVEELPTPWRAAIDPAAKRTAGQS